MPLLRKIMRSGIQICPTHLFFNSTSNGRTDESGGCGDSQMIPGTSFRLVERYADEAKANQTSKTPDPSFGGSTLVQICISSEQIPWSSGFAAFARSFASLS